MPWSSLNVYVKNIIERYFFPENVVLICMMQKISFKLSFIVAVVIGLTILYVSNFFVTEERIYSQPEAYVVGAIPPLITLWEMY